MRLITPQTLANEAAARFKKMHTGAPNCYGFGADGWRTGNSYLPKGFANYRECYEWLASLGPTPRPEDIAVHLPSWVQPEWCFGCSDRREQVVLIGGADGYEVSLCESCAEKALAAFKAKSPLSPPPTLDM